MGWIKKYWLVIMGSLLLLLFFNACTKKDAYIPALATPVIKSFMPHNGYAGDTITITGSNFGSVSTITFGGIAVASYTVLNTTTIKALVGIGASGYLVVKSAGGKDSLTGFIYKGLKPIDGYLYSDEVEPASLIAHWPFNGNDSEAIHKVLPVLSDGGTPGYVTGRIGQAIRMNNNWLTYGPEATSVGTANTNTNTNDSLKNGFTLSLWAQLPDTSLLTNIFQLSSPLIKNYPLLGLAYRKQRDSTFDMDGGIANTDGTGIHATFESAFQLAVFKDTFAFTFLTMTYDPSNRSLNYYANGVLKRSVTLTNLTTNNPFPDASAALLMTTPNYATIGTFESTATTPKDTAATTIPATLSAGFTGTIDDIRLFKKLLTTQQIMDLYLLGSMGR